MYLLMIPNRELLRFFGFFAGTDLQYVIYLSLMNYIYISTMYPFISIQGISKWINTNYDTQPNNYEKQDVSVPIHQLQILNKSEYQKRRHK